MKTILEATQNLLEQHHSGIGVFIKGEINESEKLKGVRLADDSKLSFTFDDVLTKLAELIAAEPIRLLREKRNVLLASSDWTGLADSALTSETSAKWKLYRQKLRDLPSGLNTPAKVKNAIWPTKP
jgi:hypothetical protein